MTPSVSVSASEKILLLSLSILRAANSQSLSAPEKSVYISRLSARRMALLEKSQDTSGSGAAEDARHALVRFFGALSARRLTADY